MDECHANEQVPLSFQACSLLSVQYTRLFCSQMLWNSAVLSIHPSNNHEAVTDGRGSAHACQKKEEVCVTRQEITTSTMGCFPMSTKLISMSEAEL